MSDFENDGQQVTHYDPEAEKAAQAQPANASEGNEKNIRKLREEREQYKKEAEEYKRKYESRTGDDELVEYKQLKQMKQELEQQTLDLRLKSKFPDFDSVVNSQNLQKLASEDPELAYTLDSTQDMYAKAVTAYKMIKAGQPREAISEDDENFEENQYKPRSTNSLNKQDSDRPLGQANAFQRGLSQDQKSKLWAEMQEAIKNR